MNDTTIYKEDYEQIIRQAESEIKQHKIGIEIGDAIVAATKIQYESAPARPIIPAESDPLESNVTIPPGV